jgi:plastocyanin
VQGHATLLCSTHAPNPWSCYLCLFAVRTLLYILLLAVSHLLLVSAFRDISAIYSHAAMRCLYYTLSACLAFIYSATAQTATTSTSPSTQTVIVGYESHSYYPNNLTANPGDVIVFQFIAEGHTVVQSNFQEPCVPRDAYHPGRSVFFSGWYNTSAVHGNSVSYIPHDLSEA